jgi:hypothetical protein
MDKYVHVLHYMWMAPGLSAREAVECFHLQLLRVLTSGADKGHFIVKGGCNLRFFFGSVRYSEDLDLDVEVIAKDTLKNKLKGVLSSPALLTPLRAKGLGVVDVSAPKQTDTTQRWKIGLTLAGSAVPLRTKVEFSRREGKAAASDTKVEAVDRTLAQRHELVAPLVRHYMGAAAKVQKLRALCGRPQTQARDVFDLQLLFSKSNAVSPIGDKALMAQLTDAIERVMSLSFGEFRAQVVAYLDPAYRDQYDSSDAWEQMQLDVIASIEASIKASISGLAT